jgi:hypothetical protein
MPYVFNLLLEQLSAVVFDVYTAVVLYLCYLRCHLASGKTLWLCGEHQKRDRITILSNDVADVVPAASHGNGLRMAEIFNSQVAANDKVSGGDSVQVQVTARMDADLSARSAKGGRSSAMGSIVSGRSSRPVSGVAPTNTGLVYSQTAVSAGPGIKYS